MRRFAVVVTLVTLGLGAIAYDQFARGQAAPPPPAAPEHSHEGGFDVSGYPKPGSDVQIGLVTQAQFQVPAPPNTPQAGAKATVSSFRGRLIAFDPAWVGVESPGSGSKIWIPRENVAYVLIESGAATRPTSAP